MSPSTFVISCMSAAAPLSTTLVVKLREGSVPAYSFSKHGLFRPYCLAECAGAHAVREHQFGARLSGNRIVLRTARKRNQTEAIVPAECRQHARNESARTRSALADFILVTAGEPETSISTCSPRNASRAAPEV